jgi:hypothetical protein
MPHLNRSPSSPGLRNHHRQALDELPLSRNPMSTNPSSRNSVRRICSRRPRPSVASIADIFIGSLVLASFCHEHTPRRRGIATIAWSSSDRDLQSFRGKGVTSRGQLPRSQPEYSRSRFQLSQPTTRLISNGLARMDDDNVEEGRE